MVADDRMGTESGGVRAATGGDTDYPCAPPMRSAVVLGTANPEKGMGTIPV
jgi:hypothetical protein